MIKTHFFKLFIFFALAFHGEGNCMIGVHDFNRFSSEFIHCINNIEKKPNVEKRQKRRNREKKKSLLIGFFMALASVFLLLFPKVAAAVFGSFLFGLIGGLICISVILTDGHDNVIPILGSVLGLIGFVGAVKQIQRTRL